MNRSDAHRLMRPEVAALVEAARRLRLHVPKRIRLVEDQQEIELREPKDQFKEEE